jgi:hypothetical protein
MTAGLYQQHGHPSVTQRLANRQRRPKYDADAPEHHHYGDTFEGDTYGPVHHHQTEQHAHVYTAAQPAHAYANGNGNGAPEVIEGEARELEE